MNDAIQSNRLINEKSPYLLQHARNPVNWYPWGTEAFEKATAEDKPIFLSIGYSTCHWCHVMERESFEDEVVAALLNDGFVCIKVDREERPDIDSVYMDVCQALTGQGGWPLTIVMTPSQKPFFAATYIPKEQRGTYPGMLDLLPALLELWRTERTRAEEQGEAAADFLIKQAQSKPHPHTPDEGLIRSAVKQLGRSFDSQYGGFSSAPKFPMAHMLLLLLLSARTAGEPSALKMAEETLVHMYQGGMFDHIGGGFSRYSTDRRWLVPHFEKMLYDNALLLWAYTEAYADTGKELYGFVAKRIIAYVLRELRGDTGGFFCGQDADSEGVEGKYYLLTPEDIDDALPGYGGPICEWFGITKSGNFEGGSIPNLLHHKQPDVPDAQTQAQTERLLALREQRVKPATDDKVLTAWNALMITALTKAYRTFGDEAYLEAAKKAQACIETYLTKPNGDLYVRYRDGRADHDGQLSDYAFYGVALLELYAATADISFLARAAAIARRMLALFSDEAGGGLFAYSAEGEQLIARPKETYDGAMPAGNSAAAMLLVRLSRLTAEPFFMEQAQRQLDFISSHAALAPTGHCFALLAVEEYISPGAELVVVSRDEHAWNSELCGIIPVHSAIAALIKTPSTAEALTSLAPFTSSYPFPERGTAYYVCKNGACQAPVYDINACKALLAQQ